MAENETVVSLWSICNRYGRDGANGSLRGDFALELCRAYGATRQVFESVLRLEAIVQPIFQQRQGPKLEASQPIEP
jgi:hypothetical protein